MSGNVYKHICIQGLTHISCTQLRVLTPSLLSIHICASFGSTRARFPSTYTCHTPRTHAHISSHTCKPCALHAPRSTESPVHFFVRSHGAESANIHARLFVIQTYSQWPREVASDGKAPSCSRCPTRTGYSCQRKGQESL